MELLTIFAGLDKPTCDSGQAATQQFIAVAAGIALQ